MCAFDAALCIVNRPPDAPSQRVGSRPPKGHSSWRIPARRILDCATQQMLPQKSVGPLPAENRQKSVFLASSDGQGRAHVTAAQTAAQLAWRDVV